MSHTLYDPKKVILESFKMDGITSAECRSIFLDWALDVPLGEDTKPLLQDLLAYYQPDHPDHPMTQVLREGLAASGPAKRRGGRAARVR